MDFILEWYKAFLTVCIAIVGVSGKIDGLNPQLTDLKRLTDLLMENELRGTRSSDS